MRAREEKGMNSQTNSTGLAPAHPEALSLGRGEAATLLEQAEAAFVRDFPVLLAGHRGEWVAYHGDQQLGVASTKAALQQECLRRGLPADEFVVWSIEPVVEEMTLGARL
jgi:hypothetical protein